VIFLNIPQIISEVKTNFQNAKNFYSGITVKSDETVDDPEIDQSNKLLYSTAWHIQANYLFIAPLGDDTDSDFLKVINKIKDNKGGVSGIKKNIPFFLGIFLGSIFSVAGYFLLIQAVKQETDERKKTFLMLILLQIVLAFFILWPLAHLLVLRYFLMFQFLPFLFLGLIIKAFNEKFTQKAYLPALTIIFLLCTFNIYRIGREFHDSANDRGRLRFALWGEEEAMGNFILSHTEPGQRVHMVYEPLSANKYIRPLSYFAKGIDFPKKPNTGEPTEKDAAYFSMILNTKQEKNIQERRLKKQNFYNIVDSIEFGRLKIYKLELKK
jgi:hypothetical protein